MKPELLWPIFAGFSQPQPYRLPEVSHTNVKNVKRKRAKKGPGMKKKLADRRRDSITKE